MAQLLWSTDLVCEIRTRYRRYYHWVGLRGNLNRKPMGFFHQIGWAFRLEIFPSSNSMILSLLASGIIQNIDNIVSPFF